MSPLIYLSGVSVLRSILILRNKRLNAPPAAREPQILQFAEQSLSLLFYYHDPSDLRSDDRRGRLDENKICRSRAAGAFNVLLHRIKRLLCMMVAHGLFSCTTEGQQMSQVGRQFALLARRVLSFITQDENAAVGGGSTLDLPGSTCAFKMRRRAKKRENYSGKSVDPCSSNRQHLECIHSTTASTFPMFFVFLVFFCLNTVVDRV